MDDLNLSQPSTSGSQSRRMTQSQNQNGITSATSLKSCYMQLLDEANSIGGVTNVRQSIMQIKNVIDRADQLFPKVQDTTEMFLDAKIFNSATTSLEETTNSVDVGEDTFKLLPFAEKFKMKALNNEGKYSWEVLAAAAEPVVQNSLPSWFPLLGSFDFSMNFSSSQQKKVRQVRQRDEVVEKKEPEKLSQPEKNCEGVEEIVQHIFSKLKRHYRHNKSQPISYFRFVLNPKSFSDTVENIFHVSFLVNDGHVKLELDGDEPMIAPVSKGKENSNPENAPQAKDKKQNIFSIDMRTWKDLVAGLNITEAMI